MRCDLDGIRIHYESRGRGRTFLMLHGSPSDHSRVMAELEPAFRARVGWQRIYPDLPGHGKSPGSDRIHDMDDYLEAILEFVDRVARGGRYSIGGISFGAYLALAVARQRPTKLDGLLLSVPEVNFSPLEDRRTAAFRASAGRMGSDVAPNLPPYSEDTSWLQSLPYRDVRVPLYRRTEPITVPTLFLFGRQDAPFRYRQYWRMLPDFPRATYAILDSAEHSLWEDRAAPVLALVQDWLDRVESDSPSRSQRRSPAQVGRASVS